MKHDGYTVHIFPSSSHITKILCWIWAFITVLVHLNPVVYVHNVLGISVKIDSWNNNKPYVHTAKYFICKKYLITRMIFITSTRVSFSRSVLVMIGNSRADSRLEPRKWETSLQGNAVSHWLSANQCILGVSTVHRSRSHNISGNVLCKIISYQVIWTPVIRPNVIFWKLIYLYMFIFIHKYESIAALKLIEAEWRIYASVN